MKTMEDILVALQEPTPLPILRFLPNGVDQDQGTAMALPYFDARFTQARLDAACGPFGWQSDVKEIRGFVCVGIAIRNPENGEWVWRWDTGQEEQTKASGEEGSADEDDDDRVGGKAILSRGFKRAGVQFGIGRDVYALPKVRCKVNLNAKGQVSGWKEDVVAVIEAKQQHRPRQAPSPEVAARSSEPVAAQETPSEPPNGSKRLNAANAFGDHASAVHASQEQIKRAIAQCTKPPEKTDWIEAIKALDRIMAEADTVPF